MCALDVRDQLRELGDNIREAYTVNRRVMSYAEYLSLIADRPTEHLRSAPQYTKDCFDYFGSDRIKRPWGQVRRFRLFDCPWADGRDRLVGQEDVQNQVYRSLCNFVQDGAANKLILLHGPNGSAKSTFIRCVGRALQQYSKLDVGALYRINWIFPGTKTGRGGIGFSGTGFEEVEAKDSYAYLPDELIDAKVRDELRDHPLFLVPTERRSALLTDWLDGSGDFVLSDYIRYGRLSHKNRAIFEALLANYQGDYLKVLRHVQVERFFVQHRYREGYVTVEPQLSVDAFERQITADRSIAALPAALQSVNLFDYGGELVDGNRGLIEYSDLLKRPLEAYKYLLATVEHASVSLPSATLFLDLVFMGTSNEIHLSAFKEIPEFQSFRGRLNLVRVPYLLDFEQERGIYREKLREAAAARHVAPHCDYVAALWAVLTRMRKPMADKYPQDLSEIVGKLTPLEKAELYAQGVVPSSVPASKRKELLGALVDIWNESENYPNYEGRTGASPREMQSVLFNAANSSSYAYVSPLAILDEIVELCKHTSVYEFLKQETVANGFHDHTAFIGIVKERLIDLIDDEVRESMGMVEEVQYERMFERYVTHVIHWVRNEKVRNPTTNALEDPDEKMMSEVEEDLSIDGQADEFRHDLIAKIGAWSLDHRSQKPIYKEIFAEHFKRLQDAYYQERRRIVAASMENLVHFVTGNRSVLDRDEMARAEETLERLRSRGYIDESARDAISLLYRQRYAD